jgi:hypothetical protein
MRLRNSALLSVTLAGTLALAGACAKKDDAPTPGTSGAAPSATAAPADAKSELVAAYRKLNGTTSTFGLDTDIGSVASLKGSGKADPANKASKSSLAVTGKGTNLTIDVLAAGTDLYMKFSAPLPGVDTSKWIHVDISKISSLSKLGIGDPADPANVKSFTDTVVSVQKSGPGAFKGTMDLTKRTTGTVSAEVIKAMGEQAKAVPFEAAVNGDGYPTSLTINMPAAGEVPATTTKTTFSDFGQPVTIDKPAPAEVQEAPAALLKQLGG